MHVHLLVLEIKGNVSWYKVDKKFYDKYIVPAMNVAGFGIAIGGLVVAIIALWNVNYPNLGITFLCI